MREYTFYSAGVLSESEKELFQGKSFPRRELVSMARVKTITGNEFLMRQERWVGLTAIGGTVSVFVNGDIDYTHRVPITPTTIKKDDVEIKVLKVGSPEFSWSQLPKIWTTKFNRSNVEAAIQKAQPYTDDNGVQAT